MCAALKISNPSFPCLAFCSGRSPKTRIRSTCVTQMRRNLAEERLFCSCGDAGMLVAVMKLVRDSSVAAI